MTEFKSTSQYIVSPELRMAVNAAVLLKRPLLVKGEPGTGKTMLAEQIAHTFHTTLLQWYIKSTTKAQQGLYEYDAVSRLRDSQLGNERVTDIANYIIKGKIWQAFEAEKPVVLLIDEIDKADIEFPNDLLVELDRMEFFCYETQTHVVAKHRPIIIITSNNEKELPDAFLRRCFFHYITFPDKDSMRQIIEVHYPGIEKKLVNEALQCFYDLRDMDDLRKKPSTSELIDWLQLLCADEMNAEQFKAAKTHKTLPHLGALLKNEQDTELFYYFSESLKRH